MNHCWLEEETQERASLYALGAMSQREARSFEEHLAEGCETCLSELEDFEAVMNKLAFGAPEASPREEARDKLLSRLSAEDETPPPAPTSARHEDSQPSLVVRADEGQWHRMCAGVIFKMLFKDPTRQTVTTLIKMEPGSYIPMHRHHGIEECYVIEGDAFANNVSLKAGDYTCAMKDSIHHPISTVSGALLLIVGPETYEVLA
ncbi:MAG: cupin domain-containing protein [Acidobacteria bacterium]|nr:cupin domain-containing protein [Acidobacteriota bacterium]